MRKRFKEVGNFEDFVNTASFSEKATLYSIATGIPLSFLLMGHGARGGELPSEDVVLSKIREEETKLTEFLNK